MMNKSGYYLFRVEKVIENDNNKPIMTLYIIDFVVEADFNDFLTNNENIQNEQQMDIKNQINKFHSSHILLRGIEEELKEDEVFQMSSELMQRNFERNSESRNLQETLNQYDVFYNRFIGFLDIKNTDIKTNENVIGKRNMTRQYSEAYSFVSDYKLFR